MWLVCLSLLVAAEAASLGRRPLDIPVEIVYENPGKSLTQDTDTVSTLSLRNHDEKLQLSPEEIVEAQVLNIPENIVKFNEKVQQEVDQKIKEEVAKLPEEPKPASDESSSNESSSSEEDSNEETVQLLNETPKPVAAPLATTPEKKEPALPQIQLDEAKPEVIQDEAKPQVVEAKPVQQDEPKPVVQHEPAQPVQEALPETPKVTEQLTPEIKFEEIESPQISSDSLVVENEEHVAQQVVEQIAKHVAEHVKEHIVETVADEKVNEPVNDALPEEVTEEKKEAEKVVVPVVKEEEQIASESRTVENSPVEQQLVKEEEKIQEVAKETVVVPEVQQDEPAKKPEDEKKEEVKEKELDAVKARQINDEAAKPEEPKPEEPKPEEAKPEVKPDAKPEVAKPEPAGPLAGISNALNQLGQNVQSIFRPQNPNKKPEDEATTESWVSGIQQNLNTQLQSFNNTFNDFVNNLRPAKPAESTQSDETAPAPAPNTPFLDTVQNTFNAGFSNFQSSINSAINNFNQPQSQDTKPQADTPAPSNQNIFQTGFQNAATTFTEAVSNIVTNFQGNNANQNQNDEAGTAQNNLPNQVFSFFQNGMNNIAQVLNQNRPQSDETTQPSGPFQAFQNVLSGVGQQINNLVGGQTQKPASEDPQPSLPAQVVQAGQNLAQEIPIAPPAQVGEALAGAQGLPALVQETVGSLVPQEAQNLPKPELPQVQEISNAIRPTS